MDIEDLTASLSVLTHNGTCFNIEERFQLEVALQELLNSAGPTDFDELLFWGRVGGLKADYYIAMGICYKDRYEFPEKKFYWCSSTNQASKVNVEQQVNAFTFVRFDPLNDQHKPEYNTRAQSMFSGDAFMILGKPVEKDKETLRLEQEAHEKKMAERDPLASTEEEDPASKIIPINCKEVDRLHYHIMAIENDCHIVPQGSMKLTSAHEVARNEAFQGLTEEEAYKIDFYSHFRHVQDAQKRDGLEADDAIFLRNFLDDVVGDQPKGCWTIQKGQSSAIIRHNAWSGYTAFHTVGTQNHGSCYIGDGLKNNNICFEL